MKAFITGGAGFIGSNLVDRLLKEGNQVTVYDNLSTGKEEFISHNYKNKNFRLIKKDLLNLKDLKEAIKGHDAIFHLSSYADIAGGMSRDPMFDIKQNLIATYNVLQAMRVNNIKKIVFSSSATVYGDPTIFPTPETYGPMIPISIYGAMKLADEALIASYCHMFDFQAWVFRFAKVIGERYSHGVIFDFIKKLKQNPKELLILGNGKQKMTTVHVNDLIDAILLCFEKTNDSYNLHNIGNTSWIEVNKIADLVCEELKLKNVKYNYTGGERGWRGDQPKVFLDISKLMKLGWKPKINVEEAIKLSIRYLLENPDLLRRDLSFPQ